MISDFSLFAVLLLFVQGKVGKKGSFIFTLSETQCNIYNFKALHADLEGGFMWLIFKYFNAYSHHSHYAGK